MAEKTKRFAKKRANGDPINEIKVSREGQPDPKPFAGGGIASGMRRFNRGGKV